MKRALFTVLILILGVAALAGCTTGPNLQPQLDQLTAQNQQMARQVTDLETALAKAQTAAQTTAADGGQAELAAAQDAVDKLTADLAASKAELADKTAILAAEAAGLADLRQIIDSVELQNPSAAALMTFLAADDTDKIPYDRTGFDCDGFSITVRDNAAKLGIRGGFVDIQYSDRAIGHAVAVFDTTDQGKIYIDCIARDDIAYVKNGEIYGTIPISALKTRFVQTSGASAQFWGPLEYTTYGLSLYEYAYYANYSQRVTFFTDSMNAYNQAVDRYNGGDRSIPAQNLQQWQKNLQALGKDIGESYILPGNDVVALVLEFWN
jgi:cell division protein FtsB